MDLSQIDPNAWKNAIVDLFLKIGWVLPVLIAWYVACRYGLPMRRNKQKE